jgi:deoxyribodipyrimidine photo-lyase
VSANPAIFWFRKDLRLSDNPGLGFAATHYNVIPIFILDDETPGDFKLGGAGRWWLHHSLKQLNLSLSGKLNFYKGEAKSVIEDIIKRKGVKAVYWNRCYEPYQIQQDKEIKSWLKAIGVECKSFNASLLWEPWEVLKSDGTPYKVFTPFYRRGCLLNAAPPRFPVEDVTDVVYVKDEDNKTSLDDFKLIPSIKWYEEMEREWQPGEVGAKMRFSEFLKNGLKDYKEGRNYPALSNNSKLSPHLHFGEISPHEVWHGAIRAGKEVPKDLDHFLSELAWREFSYYLLYHFPNLPIANFQSKFDQFPWEDNKEMLKAWQRGQTGYPIVDAGMRELWQTGYMHNRVRMIVGSFLVKNLLISWKKGERWFWDCLLDADIANNSASWQWVAGSGADAAPYFRIFNPTAQAEKFDPEGIYIRRFIPELAQLPTKYLFEPWKAPSLILKSAGVELGENYPKPIVGLELSRKRALSAFASLRNGNGKFDAGYA